MYVRSNLWILSPPDCRIEVVDKRSLSPDQRPVSRSRDHSQPFRVQYDPAQTIRVSEYDVRGRDTSATVRVAAELRVAAPGAPRKWIVCIHRNKKYGDLVLDYVKLKELWIDSKTREAQSPV